METYPLTSTLTKVASEAAEDSASRWQLKVTDSVEAVIRKMAWRMPLTSELRKRFPIEDMRKYTAWTMIVRWLWKARNLIKKCHSDEVSGEFEGIRFTDTHTAWRVMSEFQDDRIDRDCPMNNFDCQSAVHSTTSEIQALIEEMHEHSQGDGVISVVDECSEAVYGVMAYAKRWHMGARSAVRVWASRWKAHSMSESTDSRHNRQAWRAFAGSFRAYELSNQDEIRASALKKERAHTQGMYNGIIKSMKRSEIQKAFSRTCRMLHESQQLVQAQQKLLRMELKAKRVRQLDADKLDEEDMRKVELEAHIARLTVSTQQLSVGSSQEAWKQAKKNEKQAVKTLRR